MSDCIIVVDHAEKRFGEQVALRDVSVSFEAGKIHGIIGRNGSGKTVLFKCIVGLMPLTSGSIQVNGRHIETGKTVPDDIGAIIETPGFLPNYSGFRNLKFLATLGVLKMQRSEKLCNKLDWILKAASMLENIPLVCGSVWVLHRQLWSIRNFWYWTSR